MSQRDLAATLKEAGLNNVEIGKELGISRHAVRRLLNKPVPTDVPWGQGRASLVSPATKEESELVVFGSDFHFPYQDTSAVASFLSLVEELQPHRVVLNGDLSDFFQLSRFNTGLQRIDELQNEIDQANDFRGRVRAAAPNAVLDETCGNHDSRIVTYVEKNARSLSSLRALQPSELFKYGEYEINWHPGCGFLLRENYLTKHGTLVRGEAGATAKAELALAGVSGISGHTHRLARYRKSGYSQREWMEGGCFCRLDADYLVGIPNWTRGGAVGEFSTKTSSFVVHEVPYVDGKLRFGKDSF